MESEHREVTLLISHFVGPDAGPGLVGRGRKYKLVRGGDTHTQDDETEDVMNLEKNLLPFPSNANAPLTS